MQILDLRNKIGDSSLKTMGLGRPINDDRDLEKTVFKILNKVRDRGDKAIKSYTKLLDEVTIKKLQVTVQEIQEADGLVSEELKQAIKLAAANIRKFHEAQVLKSTPIQMATGVECWSKSVAINRVGLYIPAGSAPLFSSLLMLGIPAVIAGCEQIVLCTPPDKNGKVHPAILFTASLIGLTSIYKCGGAQAIAGMAYGTETIPWVHKIFGPGNRFVTMAKQLVQKDGVSIDMPAGPTELLVYADKDANPVFVAADLLSQAEHGADSQVVLVSYSESVLRNVKLELDKQLETLPRKEIAEKSLQNSKAVLVLDDEEAMKLINAYAPEHLILNCSNADALAEKVINAGSVFLGNYSPESAGDYATGTNHVLPTNGYAKSYSGVSVDSFVKKISYQKLTGEGLKNIAPAIELMAAAEGLEGHKRAVTYRINKDYVV